MNRWFNLFQLNWLLAPNPILVMKNRYARIIGIRPPSDESRGCRYEFPKAWICSVSSTNLTIHCCNGYVALPIEEIKTLEYVEG